MLQLQELAPRGGVGGPVPRAAAPELDEVGRVTELWRPATDSSPSAAGARRSSRRCATVASWDLACRGGGSHQLEGAGGGGRRGDLHGRSLAAVAASLRRFTGPIIVTSLP
eukprot:SM000308S11826  [mRNA]  locus=s308:259:768:+ [translate_table: standard]